MRSLITLMILFFLKQASAVSSIQVFVSFSMPDTLLKETLKDCVRLNIPAYLNGLHHHSMQQTVMKVMRLSQSIPNLTLQIDPTAFERFSIQQVPALVVKTRQGFDVIYGHLSLKEALFRLASSKNDSGLTLREARRITHEQ